MNYNDLQLAHRLCNKNGNPIELQNAQRIIQQEMLDTFMYYSKKLAKRTYEYRSGWDFITRRGVRVRITDDIPSSITRKKPAGVMDAYYWIVNYISKKSCYYKGIDNASLKHYINTVLSNNSKYDWLSYIYGDPNYIPVCIQQLPEEYQNIFLRLRRVKNIEKVKSELTEGIPDIDQKLSLIKRTLLHSGLIDLIMEIEISEIDENLNSTTDSELGEETIKNLVVKLGSQINNLDTLEREILVYKYHYSYSVKEIIKLFQSNNRLGELKKNGMKNEKQMYKKIDKILNEIVSDVLDMSINKVNNRKEVFKILYEELERSLA